MGYADEVLADNPLVYWRLGEPSGTVAADSSGNSNAGTYAGGPALGVPGLQTSDADTAAQFVAADDHGVIGDDDLGSTTYPNFTLECVVKFDDLASSYQVLVAVFSAAFSGYIILAAHDGNPTTSGRGFDISWTGVDTGHGTLTVTPHPADIAVDTVYHVVATYDGTDVYVYVNGVLYDTTDVFHDDASFPDPAFMLVGNADFGSGYGADATIDEAAFYTTALSAARIEAHYAAMSSPPAPVAGLQVRTVTMDGTELDVLPLASVGDVVRTLDLPDGPTTWSFPKYAYTPAQIPVLGTDEQPVEVQIWTTVDGERDLLLFWGPTVDIQGSGSDGAMQCTGVGVDWYLIRRYLDGQRTNLLSNPSFETGDLTSWYDGGAVTSTVTDDGKVLGTKAARLVSSTPGGDIHIHQLNEVIATGVGTLLTVAAWYQIESFTAAAYARCGLYVEGLQASVVRATSTVTIDENTPTGVWLRAETTIWIPPDQTWDIDVRCYSIDGSILWDAVELVAMQSVSTAGLTGTVTGEADLTKIVRQHIDHLQDSAVGKSDVNISTDPDRAEIGVRMAKHIQWADHIAWDSQLREFQERGDGIDTAILYDPDAGTREFRVFHPRRAANHVSSSPLTFPGNVADYEWQRDGTATVTTATWVGDGDGPDREEGYATDPSSIGGLTLEDVKQAPTGSAISSLEPLAAGEVALLHNPPRVITVHIRPDAVVLTGDNAGLPLLEVFDPGDIVALNIDDGYVQEDATEWRIVKLVFHGDNRVLTATLNEEPA